MTPTEVETEVRARGLGWNPITLGTIREDEASAACNPTHCQVLATIGNDAGVTLGELVDAVELETDGDPSAMKGLAELARAARA